MYHIKPKFLNNNLKQHKALKTSNFEIHGLVGSSCHEDLQRGTFGHILQVAVYMCNPIQDRSDTLSTSYSRKG